MNIVIIGAGKIGATLTEQLLREGHEITVVDTRTAALDAIGNTLDVMTVEGNGISMDTQVEAAPQRSRASCAPRPPSRSTRSRRAAWSCTRCASTPAPYSTA